MSNKLENIERMARSALPLTREPRPPTGGMRTGDMIEVGMRDWFKLLRLAKYAASDPTDGGEEG